MTAFPAIFLSGFFFPREAMPKALQLISYALPTRYYLRIIHSLMLKGVGVVSLQEDVLALLVFGMIFITVGPCISVNGWINEYLAAKNAKEYMILNMAFLRFSILVVGLTLVLVLGISWVCNAEMYDLADREEPGEMDETFPVTDQSISMPEIKIAATLFQATLQPIHTTGAPTEFTPQTTPTERTNILAKIRYWGYQIEGHTENGAVDALAESHYEMLVLEPTRTDWSSDAKFFNTNGMAAWLKSKVNEALGRPPLVIAYIVIGEAEDWRWYWSWSTGWNCQTPRPADWPDYIITCDPDGWTGNYPVAYWDSAWKDIIIYGKHTGDYPERDYRSVIDKVIKDGFDGVYLD